MDPVDEKKTQLDELSEAIKTMRNPLQVDPLERHDFDSFIVESF